jgi:hypothetical protein
LSYGNKVLIYAKNFVTSIEGNSLQDFLAFEGRAVVLPATKKGSGCTDTKSKPLQSKVDNETFFISFN